MQDEISETALIAAINKGHTDVVETLIQAGANINFRDKVRLFLIDSCS